ncbi:MAG: tetratricopeptide repeat protein, partial [Abditibacteriales bacterium]|nr:tetratricopeptide repeat protein [Abditibacteriales bacterium]MDW8368462.1 tetratricopeptide repeat protein [Abditibacteriales bacterium]
MRRFAFGLRFWTLGFGFCLLVVGHWSFPPAAVPDAPPQPHPDVAGLLAKGMEAYQAYKFDEALRFLNEALVKSRALKDKQGEAETLHNIGAVYDNLGQPQKALDYYQRALPLQ